MIDARYRSLFRAEQVTEADVEKWFTYLISGFDRAFAPSLPQGDGIPSAQLRNRPNRLPRASG